ncbi:MAG: hypothetical protein J6B39_04745 [Lachnospiraceae bacterium]|nr:hypothetical protein [Lachnospiraceae bacterium]
MGFVSILGTKKFGEHVHSKTFFETPSYFEDLNLNQIVDQIRSMCPEYDLKKYYYVLLEDPEQIRYRHDVFKDFYNDDIIEAARDFSNGLYNARNYMEWALKSEHPVQRKRWKIDSAYSYIVSVRRFAEFMSKKEVVSAGMQEFKAYLTDMVAGKEFNEFADSTIKLMEKMFSINFTLEIERNSITVNAGRTDEHYVERIGELLEKENIESIGSYFNSPLRGNSALSVLETKIVAMLQKEFPNEFAELDEYDKKYDNFLDTVLVQLEEEMQFYISYALFRKRIAGYGLTFCTPEVYEGTDKFVLTDVYDLALACRNSEDGITTVSNTIDYRDKERFLVITGPNQGGKTTSARSMGQAVYFAMIGLEVPAAAAKLPLFHDIMTHFEVEESLETGAGKLKEELNRLKPMMERTGKRKFVVINELFTTAASYDAYIMGSHVLKHFIELDYFGIYVTHIKELAQESEAVASLVAGLSAEDGKTRTFKIERRPSEGVGHASVLVDKYNLSYEDIKEGLLK